jgi:hypothetical protein
MAATARRCAPTCGTWATCAEPPGSAWCQRCDRLAQPLRFRLADGRLDGAFGHFPDDGVRRAFSRTPRQRKYRRAAPEKSPPSIAKSATCARLASCRNGRKLLRRENEVPINTVDGTAVAPNRSVLSLRVSTTDCVSVSGVGCSEGGRPSMPARCSRSPHTCRSCFDTTTEGTGSPWSACICCNRWATACAASALPCSFQCVSVCRNEEAGEPDSTGARSSVATPEASSFAVQSRTRASSAGARRSVPRCVLSMRLLSGTTTTSSAMCLPASARAISATAVARAAAWAVRSR